MSYCSGCSGDEELCEFLSPSTIICLKTFILSGSVAVKLSNSNSDVSVVFFVNILNFSLFNLANKTLLFLIYIFLT